MPVWLLGEQIGGEQAGLNSRSVGVACRVRTVCRAYTAPAAESRRRPGGANHVGGQRTGRGNAAARQQGGKHNSGVRPGE